MPRVRRATRTMVLEIPEEPTAKPAEQPAPRPTDGIEQTDVPISGKQPKGEVWRIHESGKRVYLCEIAPENATEAFFQQQFGGGTYQVELYKRAAAGADRQLVKGGQREIRIDPRIPSRLPSWLEVPTPAQPGAPAQVARANTDDEDPEMRQLFKHRLLSLVEESDQMRDRSNAAMLTMLSTVTKMMESSSQATAALIASFSKAGNTGGGGTKELLEAVSLLERLRPAQGVGAVDQFSMFDKFLGVMRKMQDSDLEVPGEGKERGGGLIEEAARTLLPAIVGAMKPPAQPVQAPPPAPPAPRPAPIAPAAAPTPEPTMHPLVQSALERLYESAQEGDTPEEAAILLFDACPKVYRGLLREQAFRKDAVEQLVAAVPQFADYPDFLARVVAELRAQFEPPAEPAGGVRPENN